VIGYNLTETEQKILGALAKGASNQEISQQFSITVSTVKYHLTNIFSKLGVRNRVEATTLALENNLVEKNHQITELP
jgi:DNA-binding NarL/FixJ family response regulator